MEENLKEIVQKSKELQISPEVTTHMILWYLDDEGLSLLGNGWLNEDEIAIKNMEMISSYRYDSQEEAKIENEELKKLVNAISFLND